MRGAMQRRPNAGTNFTTAAKPDAATRILHVANGTCTTRLIGAAGLPGVTSIWADPLYDGPVPGGLTDDELVEVRTRHLTGGDATRVDPVNDLRRWRAAIAAHDAYDELVLWFEHDLFDQLNLLQLLPWIREQLPSSATVSLVCIGSFPGHPAFKGFGELAPHELAPLFGDRVRVSHAQYALAARAWDAFRAPTPEALDDLRHGDITALPFLAPAITRFLQEYPWTRDGLSRSERRLLELAADGPVALATAFPRMADDGDVYHVTDLSMVDIATALSTATLALLAYAPDDGDPAGPLGGTVALTEIGAAVLAARADRVAIAGIDRWLGGVHLHDGEVWRWDDRAQRVGRERR
jgi:hypothetical protein